MGEVPLFGQALAASGGEAVLQGLRTEYTRLFLMNLHPYESAYLDPSGMLNTPISGAVLQHYREQRFEPQAMKSAGAPDHLGLELLFMAEIIEREAVARQAGNTAVGDALADDQRHFLEAHLLRWAPILGKVLSELAGSLLYRTLGQTIETFLLGEFEALAGAPADDPARS